MDKGWFIGQERISTSDPGSFSAAARPSITVNLTQMLRASSLKEDKKPVQIRPPSPKAPRAPEFRRSLSCEPPPKPIIRHRSYSLPPPKGNKSCKHVGVRFVDSLGLDLEDIKLFKAGDEPLVPHHVTFKLLMAAEMTDGRHLEISLPYLKPALNQQPGDRPEFLCCLRSQNVCLERVLCFELGVIGITQVVNLDFEKDVQVRYSFTDWKSFAETRASWVSTNTRTWADGGQFSCDTFRFHLPVPPFLQPGATLEFAIQYRVSGQEFWDNNFGQNYKLVCHNYKLTVPKECQDSMVHFV